MCCFSGAKVNNQTRAQDAKHDVRVSMKSKAKKCVRLVVYVECGQVCQRLKLLLPALICQAISYEFEQLYTYKVFNYQ